MNVIRTEGGATDPPPLLPIAPPLRHCLISISRCSSPHPYLPPLPFRVNLQVLFLGTAVYNGSLKLPFVPYGDDYAMLDDETATPGMRAPPSLATSALMKSPLLRRMSREYESPAGALTLAARAAARRATEAAAAAADSTRQRASSSERQGLVYGKRGAIGGDPEYGSAE